MSRTIRRKGAKCDLFFDTVEDYLNYHNDWYDLRGYSMRYGRNDCRARQYLTWRYHADGLDWTAGRRQTKPDTANTRRRFDRDLQHRLMKDPEHDYYDREKKYLGMIWFYD